MGTHIGFTDGRRTVNSMYVGSRIRALRKARGLNQTQLAKAIGVDQSTISDIERGANFGAEVLMSLSKALGSTCRYIMKGGTEAELFEAEVIGLFRALSEDDQAHMLRTLRALAMHAKNDPPPPPPTPKRGKAKSAQ